MDSPPRLLLAIFLAPMPTDDGRLCKICLARETEDEKMPECHPCKCTGSLKYVHASCLQTWLKTASTKQCELCLYQYKFQNIYKRNTPEKIDVLVIASVLCRRFFSTLHELSKISFSVTLRLLVVYCTSAFYSLLFLSKKALFDEHHFFNGPLLVFVSIGLRALKKSVVAKLETLRKRRVATITAECTPCTSATHSEMPEMSIDGEERPASVAERVAGIGISYDGLGDAHVSINTPIDDPLALLSNSADEDVFARFKTPFEVSLKSNLKWLFFNASLIVLLKLLLIPSKMVEKLFSGAKDVAFFDFLVDHNLKGLFCNMLGLLIGILHLVFVLRNVPALRQHYVLAKVAFFVYYELFVSTAMLGIAINYALFRFFHFRNFLFDHAIFRKPLFLCVNGSIALTYACGLCAMLLLSTPIIALKKIYRPGALFFFRNASEFDVIKKILTTEFKKLVLHQATVSAVYSASIVATALLHRNLLAAVSFEIASYKKLLVYVIVLALIAARVRALGRLYKRHVRTALLVLCSVAGCADYFFAKKKRVADKKNLRWCPNRDTKYSRRQRLAYFSKAFTDDEFRKFYLERSAEPQYALYHVPRLFRYRCAFVHAAAFALAQLAIGAVFRLALVANAGAKRCAGAAAVFYDDAVPSDMRFLLGTLFVLSAAELFCRACAAATQRVSLSRAADGVSDGAKAGVIYFFRLCVWPAIATLVVLNSLGVHDSVKADRIFLYCIFDIFLVMVIATHVAAELVRAIGLFPAVETISVVELVRKLVFVTSLNVVIVLVTTLYEAVVIKRTFSAGYGQIYLVMAFVMVFVPIALYYAFVCARRALCFVRNIKDELFLERRQAMNYESYGE